MKKILLVITAIACFSCEKDNTIVAGTTTPTISSTQTGNVATIFDITGQTLVSSGNFMSNAHPTEGKAKLYVDKDKKYTLVVEGYKGDPGPDLRVYFSEDTKATNFVEISDKVITKGDFVVKLPTNANVDKQKFVLIWCKQFSVLFGNVELK